MQKKNNNNNAYATRLILKIKIKENNIKKLKIKEINTHDN